MYYKYNLERRIGDTNRESKNRNSAVPMHFDGYFNKERELSEEDYGNLIIIQDELKREEDKKNNLNKKFHSMNVLIDILSKVLKNLCHNLKYNETEPTVETEVSSKIKYRVKKKL